MKDSNNLFLFRFIFSILWVTEEKVYEILSSFPLHQKILDFKRILFLLQVKFWWHSLFPAWEGIEDTL